MFNIAECVEKTKLIWLFGIEFRLFANISGLIPMAVQTKMIKLRLGVLTGF